MTITMSITTSITMTASLDYSDDYTADYNSPSCDCNDTETRTRPLLPPFVPPQFRERHVTHCGYSTYCSYLFVIARMSHPVHYERAVSSSVLRALATAAGFQCNRLYVCFKIYNRFTAGHSMLSTPGLMPPPRRPSACTHTI